MIYRELLASETLDPEPMQRLTATMQLGFATLATYLTSLVAGFGGEMTEVPPSAFDPFAKRDGRGRPASKDTVHCGPNQMARLMSGIVELI